MEIYRFQYQSWNTWKTCKCLDKHNIVCLSAELARDDTILFQDFEKQPIDWSHPVNPVSDSQSKDSVSLFYSFFFSLSSRFWLHWLNIVNFYSRDLAQNKLSGEIPRLIYWNEVLQYLWVIPTLIWCNVRISSSMRLFCPPHAWWILWSNEMQILFFTVNGNYLSGVCEGIIYKGPSHLICASWLGCGTCECSFLC